MRTVPAAVTGLLKRRSIHNRNIQPELLRAEPRADIFGGADDRSRQPAANAAGFRHRFAISAANDRTGKERIACAGGINHVYLFGGYNATFAIRAGVHRAFVPHGNNHARGCGRCLH